tara:strand:- start:4524 stop:5567 length:1044 start_codon:yes stop_codon:yes gene_type:complete
MAAAIETRGNRIPALPRDRSRLILAGLAVALAAMLGVALGQGAVQLSLFDILTGAASEFDKTVLQELRGPRVLLAAFVGMGLALSGAVLQGLFRNPLADPGLIGVSSGAALGAITVIVLGNLLNVPPAVAPYLLPLAAISGAALVTTFLFFFARRFGHFSMVTVLLVGIAINAIAGVGIGIFQYISDDAQLRTLTFWMMGSFGRANWTTTMPAVVLIGVGVAVLVRDVRALDLIQLGEAEARYLGVEVDALKRRIIFVAAVASGAGVAVAGMVGFVGLVVPHLIRLMGGAAHAIVLPGSALLGAALVVGSDLVARTVIVPAEIPVSLVTSAIGAPFFLWLITRVRAT